MKFVAQGAHGVDTTISTATTLTPPSGADALLLQAFTQAVRWTVDGTTPTASTGFQLPAGSSVLIEVGDGQTVKVIEETATASIQYQWFLATGVQ